MGRTILNIQVHERLKALGHEYLVIVDVETTEERRLRSMTVRAEKEIPASQRSSCTSIDDPLITTFIYDGSLGCQVFVDDFEEPLLLI